MSETYTWMGARVLVRREAAPERYGCLVLPKESRQKTMEGVVVALGTEASQVQVGDRVLFEEPVCDALNTTKEGDQLLVSESEIQAVLEVES
jgi:co-chaperonin GroES (HSP10)